MIEVHEGHEFFDGLLGGNKDGVFTVAVAKLSDVELLEGIAAVETAWFWDAVVGVHDTAHRIVDCVFPLGESRAHGQ